MQIEHAELDALVDQVVDAIQKQQLEGKKPEQHADREAAVDHEQRREPDHGHVFHAEDRAIGRLVQQRDRLAAHASVGVIDHQVLVGGATLGLAQVELDRHHAAQGFDEVGRAFGFVHDLFVLGAPLRAVEQPAHQAIADGSEHDHQRELHAVPEHQCQRQQHHGTVDDRFQERERQRALDRIDAAKARHDVADVALLEPCQRQAQELREQGVEQAQIQLRRQVHAEPGAHSGDRNLQQHEQAEAQAEHRQQIDVAADHDAIEHDLDKKRCGHREHFQHQRQQQHLRDGAAHAARRGEQLPGGDPLALIALLETRRRLQLHRHAGEVLGRLLERENAPPHGGVVHRDLFAGDAGQDHEMIHVPMQDRRQAQLAERDERRLHAARRQLHAVGNHLDVAQRDAAHRRRQAQPHRRQVGAQAVIARDHRHAGDAALRRLRLQNDRNAAAEQRHQPVPPIKRARSSSTGSNTHSKTVRRSSRMSAPTIIPGRSGMSWPATLTDCRSSLTSIR